MCALLLAAALHAAAADAGTEKTNGGRVVITAVRIIVDGIRYDWKDGGALPPRADGGFTEPSTVASFLGVRPGEETDAGGLEYRRWRAEERLRECGYFFTAQVLTAPASSREDGRIFIARVSEGFLWRFGADAYYAAAGRTNELGAAKSWTAYAGYNRDGFSWRDDAVLGSPFFYEAEALYMNRLQTAFLDYHRFSAALTAGARINPDFLLAVELPVAYRLFSPSDSPMLAQFPETTDGWEWAPAALFSAETAVRPAGTRLCLGAEGSSGITLCSTGAAFWRTEVRAYAGLELWPVIRIGVSGGTAVPIAMPLPAFSLFDLGDDAAVAVRAGYGRTELLSSAYALTRTEIRFPLPRIPLTPLFSPVVAPFLYGDAALAQAPAGGAIRDFEGFGLGARIALDNPVFAYFSISYGWNPAGSGRLCFSASSRAE